MLPSRLRNLGGRTMTRVSALAVFLAATLSFSGDTANAGACDYRPSQLIGGSGAGVVATTGLGTATAGLAAKGAGFYTLTHAVTGATMLGSTAGGASAAGTVGIMGGTAGVVGTAAGVLMAPATIIVGAITAAGIGGYEGICYFYDERVTEYTDVLKILEAIALNANPAYLRLEIDPMNRESAILVLSDGEESTQRYSVENLYVVNGVLKHRDWGLNTVVGNVGFIARSAPSP